MQSKGAPLVPFLKEARPLITPQQQQQQQQRQSARGVPSQDAQFVNHVSYLNQVWIPILAAFEEDFFLYKQLFILAVTF